jgi:hypothetical protein
MLGSSWAAAQLAASQEGLSFMSEWMTKFPSLLSSAIVLHEMHSTVVNKRQISMHIDIVTCFTWQRDNNNVDSPDLTRKFIGTIVEITHNRYNTQFRFW